MNAWIFVFVAVAVIGLGQWLVVILLRDGRLWLQSVVAGAGVSPMDLLRMRWRRVDAARIVRSKIMAAQAGLCDDSGVTIDALIAHQAAGGDVTLVIQAMIRAQRTRTGEVSFPDACTIDLQERGLIPRG